MLQLLRYFFLGILISSFPLLSIAQLRVGLNKPDHDDKPFHYDIVLGMNRSHFAITHHPVFTQQDSVMSIESINSSGIHMALYFNKRLGEHFIVRTTAFDLSFKQRVFEYNLKYPDKPGGEDSVTKKSVESIYLSFPLQIKFTSDRIDNFKVYMLAGIKA